MSFDADAKFTINGTPSEDANGNRWYVGSFGQTLSVTLETNPSPVLSVTYEVYSSADIDSPFASKNAPALTWVQSGTYRVVPAGPNDTVTIILPGSGIHSYTIRASAVLAGGSVAIYERMVALRTTTTTPAIRKTVPAETAEWERRGHSDTLNDMVEALQNMGTGFGCTLDQAYDFGGPGVGRAIDVDSGAVSLTNGNGDNNVLLELIQNDITNNKNALNITRYGTGRSIFLAGQSTQSIWSDENLLLGADLNLLFDDGNRALSGWSSAGIKISAAPSEWSAIESLIGSEGSLFAAILAAASKDGGTLDYAYDYGGPGVGSDVTVDAGEILFSVPATADNGALILRTVWSGGPPSTYLNPVLTIDKQTFVGDSVWTDSHSIFLTGAPGQNIWSDKSLYIGMEDTPNPGRCSYTLFDNGYASLISRTVAGTYDAKLELSSGETGAALITAPLIQFHDGFFNWTSSSFEISKSVDEWTNLKSYMGDTEGSLINACIATLDRAYDGIGSGAGRIIVADHGVVTINVPDESNNACLELNQSDVTNNPNALVIVQNTTGYSIHLDGASQSIWADDNLLIGADLDLRLTDQYCNWTQDYLPVSLAAGEWTKLKAYLGNTEGSLCDALVATLDRAYDGGGSGLGKSVTVDAGSPSFAVPVGGDDSAMALTNMATGNTSGVLSIYNAKSGNTGLAIDLQGEAGGGTTVDVMGHKIWSAGSLTMGHEIGSDTTARRSFTSYQYDNPNAVNSAVAIMEASAWTGYAYYARVKCTAGDYGVLGGFIDIEASGPIHIIAGTGLQFSDQYCNWTREDIPLSISAQQWTDIKTLIGSEGSIFGAILAASTGAGISGLTVGEVLFGSATGSIGQDDGHFFWDATGHKLGINGSHIPEAPPAAGITLGLGSITHATTDDDLFVGGVIECDNEIYIAPNMQIVFDSASTPGVSQNCSISYATAQTPDVLAIGLGTISRNLIICDNADTDNDFAHAQASNPTMYIHAADASDTAKWGSLSHNATEFILDSGKDLISFSQCRLKDALSLVVGANATVNHDYCQINGAGYGVSIFEGAFHQANDRRGTDNGSAMGIDGPVLVAETTGDQTRYFRYRVADGQGDSATPFKVPAARVVSLRLLIVSSGVDTDSGFYIQERQITLWNHTYHNYAWSEINAEVHQDRAAWTPTLIAAALVTDGYINIGVTVSGTTGSPVIQHVCYVTQVTVAQTAYGGSS